MKILITENKLENKLENIIKSSGITRTINLFGGFDNYCKVFKIEGPMDFLKSLPLMDVVQSEVRPDWSLFRYEKGKNMMVYDRKIETVYINYNEIWSVLSNKFELNYSETEKLTKEWLDEVYNLREVTPNKSTSFSERSWMRYTI